MTRPFPPMLIAAVVLLPLAADAEPAACPLSLPVTTHAAVPPAGWSLIRPTPARLTGGGILQGDPANEAFLAPENMKQSKGIMRWQNAFEAGDEKWLWCDYGGSTLRIVRRLPDAAKVCIVTQKEHGAARELIVDCR